jgi:hypothetical protein
MGVVGNLQVPTGHSFHMVHFQPAEETKNKLEIAAGIYINIQIYKWITDRMQCSIMFVIKILHEP